MAFDYTKFHLLPVAPGFDGYNYVNTSETLAAVAADGYFHNVTYDTKLVAGDRIMVTASDGFAVFRVSAVSAAGSITTQFAGGNLPNNTAATGTEAALSAALTMGRLEVGTSISTATRYVLPTPYAGAEFSVYRVDSGTQAMEFDAGGSGATAITYDGSARRITLKARTEGFHVVGSSATRWRVRSLMYNASAVSEGGSVIFVGT